MRGVLSHTLQILVWLDRDAEVMTFLWLQCPGPEVNLNLKVISTQDRNGRKCCHQEACECLELYGKEGYAVLVIEYFQER